MHEATCTDVNVESIGLCTQAVFAVGEVVELVLADCDEKDKVRYRARVMYRNSNHYGVGFLRSHVWAVARSCEAAKRTA